MITLPLIWLAGAAAALLYSQEQNIPWKLAFAALPAFLMEASFYCVLGRESWRTQVEKLPSAALAALLTAAAAAPYCAATLAFHAFQWRGLAVVTGIAAVTAFWYVVFPRRAATDLLFLLLLAAITISGG